MSEEVVQNRSARRSRRVEDDTTRAVREFYEANPFPGVRPVEQDGLILMRHLERRVRRHESKSGEKGLRVLDAGCGTGNTLLSLARRFPDVSFVGVDLSMPSLRAGMASAGKEGLENIRFRNWNLMAPDLDEDPFDVVLCLGVLHHTANMARVLETLRAASKSNGELYLWVYGRHGRYRHKLNQKLLSILLNAGPRADDPHSLARQFVEGPGRRALLQDLLGPSPHGGLERVLQERGWIADQFLHPKEVEFDMEELITLIRGSGFTLSEWLGVNRDLTRELGEELAARFQTLPPDQQLTVVDLWLKPDRYFVVLEQAADAGSVP